MSVFDEIEKAYKVEKNRKEKKKKKTFPCQMFLPRNVCLLMGVQ